MIVQAIGLLDDLDKELNTYAMRVREWYGWHFPEMTKIVSDNVMYAKTVRSRNSSFANHSELCRDSSCSRCNNLPGWKASCHALQDGPQPAGEMSDMRPAA